MEKIFNDGYKIIARMQKSLDNYKSNKKASSQAIEIQEEIIERLTICFDQINEHCANLIQYSDDQYKRGFVKGAEAERNRYNPNKYSKSKEAVRYQSIHLAMNKWPELY